MSKEELKIEIAKTIDTFPNNVLEMLLLFLRSIENTSSGIRTDNSLLEKIFNEDNALLQKLAQ